MDAQFLLPTGAGSVGGWFSACRLSLSVREGGRGSHEQWRVVMLAGVAWGRTCGRYGAKISASRLACAAPQSQPLCYTWEPNFCREEISL